MQLSPRSVLVTGANRGIGLQFIKEFLCLDQPPSHLFAGCRKPEEAKELQDLTADNKNVHIVKLDVTNYESFPSVVEQVKTIVGDDGLNLLINNAGVIDFATFNNFTPELMRDSYEINTIGPLMFARAMAPLLKQAATKSDINGLSVNKAAIINVSSLVGSVADNGGSGLYPYRASKCALNMVTKCLSIDLKGDGILARVIHPGWVQTALGGPNAKIDTAKSVKGMLEVFSKFDGQTEEDKMYDYKGDAVGW